MWLRARLDIGWSDLLVLAWYFLAPGRRSVAEANAQQAWDPSHQCVITLSVRSAFDLTLRALTVEPGSEVLMTALTVPDMVAIVRKHQLVPVPIDISTDGDLSLQALENALSPRSKLIVVAHLFGSIVDMETVHRFAQQHNLMVLEDCAQSFHRTGDQGHPQSLCSYFSFGPIKTATALGGAVLNCHDPRLTLRIKDLLAADPLQSRWQFAKRVGRFMVLKLISGRRLAPWFLRTIAWCGYDPDEVINNLGRGFKRSDLLKQLRQRPCRPLLKLLHRRWRRYDLARVERRQLLGNRLDKQLGRKRHASSNLYWVYPLAVPPQVDPTNLIDKLRSLGFDATQRSRMCVVEGESESPPLNIAQQWPLFVFLPWYPELTVAAVDKMGAAIKPFLVDDNDDSSNSQPPIP